MNFEDTVAYLKQQDGLLWRGVAAQTHDQYNETPIWILLKKKDDIHAAISFLRPILRDLTQFDMNALTLAFHIYEGSIDYYILYLEGDEIFASDYELEMSDHREPRTFGVLDAEYPNASWALHP